MNYDLHGSFLPQNHRLKVGSVSPKLKTGLVNDLLTRTCLTNLLDLNQFKTEEVDRSSRSSGVTVPQTLLVNLEFTDDLGEVKEGVYFRIDWDVKTEIWIAYEILGRKSISCGSVKGFSVRICVLSKIPTFFFTP